MNAGRIAVPRSIVRIGTVLPMSPADCLLALGYPTGQTTQTPDLSFAREPRFDRSSCRNAVTCSAPLKKRFGNACTWLFEMKSRKLLPVSYAFRINCQLLCPEDSGPVESKPPVEKTKRRCWRRAALLKNWRRALKYVPPTINVTSAGMMRKLHLLCPVCSGPNAPAKYMIG